MKPTSNRKPEQREDVRHGAYIFPIQKYHTTLDSLHPLLQAHWHEESEFTIIRSGQSRYHINLDDEEVETGDILFIPPLMLHSAACLEEQKKSGQPEETENIYMESDTFVFHLNFLGANTADICSMRYLIPLQNQELSVPTLIRSTHPAYLLIRAIFDELETTYDEQIPGYELEVKALLLKLLFLLMQYRADPRSTAPVSPVNVEKIRAVLTCIEEHYEEPLTIEELCGMCYFSRYHFMRFFKQHVGMTCVEYINNIRLEKAVELLEQDHRSILDIALSVGFRNVSYFHRAFLKKYHITPKTFLQIQQKVGNKE